MKGVFFPLLFLISGASAHAAPAASAEVELRWEALPGAESYEVEITRDAAMKQLLQRLTPGQNACAVILAEGRYFYRIRAIDRVHEPGRWTTPQILSIAVPEEKPPTVIRKVFAIRSRIEGLGGTYELIKDPVKGPMLLVLGDYERPGWYLSISKESRRAEAGENWPAIQGKFELRIAYPGSAFRISLNASTTDRQSNTDVVEVEVPK